MWPDLQINVFTFSKKSHFLFRKFKVAATDMRYFVRSKFPRSLVYKQNFSLILAKFFKLGYVFFQER